MSRFDVAVVGGGPAGAWTAWHLACRGARVAIVDPSHPREKPCGGGLTARAVDLVRPSGAIDGLPAVAINRADFEYRRESVRVDLAGGNGEAPLLIAARRDLDGRLLSAATARGATHVAERVVGVEPLGRGWRVATRTTAIDCDWLVGADGPNSLVRRRVSRPFARADLSIATGWYVETPINPAIDLFFETEPAGYLWSFPRPDHLAVGVCAQADETGVDGLRRIAQRWIDERFPHRSRRAYSWPIPSLRASTIDANQVSGDRWMLVGDAAGLVDPITREGIYFALQSGAAAADALANGGAAGYQERIAGGIHEELRRAARLKARFYEPYFLATMMDGLTKSPRIREVMADLVAGRQLYRGLKRRLIATREVGLMVALARGIISTGSRREPAPARRAS